jgi:hypothetical protein
MRLAELATVLETMSRSTGGTHELAVQAREIREYIDREKVRDE